MTEEPKRHGRIAQEIEEKANRWGKVKEFFFDNPTLVVTLSYLYVTVIGIIYSSALYGKFGINIFDYSEIADFLLAAFKNPVAFLAAGLLGVLGVAIGASMMFWMRLGSRDLRRHADQLKAYLKSLETGLSEAQPEVLGDYLDEDERLEKLVSSNPELRDLFIAFKREQKKMDEELELLGKRLRARMVLLAILIPLGIAFSSVFVPYYSASETASSIKDGKHPAVDVRYRSFSGSAGQMTEPGLQLIGATQKAVFFYDVDDKRTIVIPQSQIVSIEVPE